MSRNLKVDSRSLAATLALDRTLYTTFNELDDALNSDATLNAGTILGRPLTKEQGQKARDGILLELTFLSGKISAYLRGIGEPLNVDLRRVYLKGVELGGVSFGKSNLEGGQWEGVSLANADFSTVTEFENSQWIDANWWDANAIGKPLLTYLIANQYPYHPPVADYSNAPSSAQVYQAKVMKLCGSAGLNCASMKLPFGTAPNRSDKKTKIN